MLRGAPGRLACYECQIGRTVSPIPSFVGRCGVHVMNETTSRSVPVGTYLVLALALGLLVAIFLNAHVPAGGGESRIANAFLLLYLTLFLWLALALLLFIAGIMGEMPRWAAISFVLLHPLSGAAIFAAIDMSERHGWALVFVAVLPALTAAYALWARLPELRAKYPAKKTSLLMLGAILVLSIVALLAAM